jgi:hypothetical protein
MMAFRVQTDECSSVAQNFAVQFCNYTNIRTPSQSQVCTPIMLEPCTPDHFSVIPNIRDKFSQITLDTFSCLPINQTYTLKGNYDVSSTATTIEFVSTCQQTCNVNNCGSVYFLQLNALINPQNSQKPFEYYLQRGDMQVGSATSFYYTNEIDENTLITDNSLTPVASLSTATAIGANNLYQNTFRPNAITPQTFLAVVRSKNSDVVTRRYMTLLDVISYVGGLFPVILGVFFFIKYFGEYFFLMSFAHDLFRCPETRTYGLRQYLKQQAYSLFQMTGLDLSNCKRA